MQKNTPYYRYLADDNRANMLAFIVAYCVFLSLLGIGGFMLGRDKVIQYTTMQLNAPTSQRLPSISLNMRNAGAEAGSVKFAFSLEVAVRDTKKVEGYMPRIMDRVQTVLNQTPVEQLRNTTDLHFVRENMLSQINKVSGPVRVTNIYFDKLLTTN